MLGSLTKKSNRVVSTMGTAIVLLLAVNLGITLNSYFLQPPYQLATVVTYVFIFLGAIAYLTYYTITQLNNPSKKYIEGLVLGICGSTAILVYLPDFLFQPIALRFDDIMSFFIILYSIAIISTFVLSSVVVKGAELYGRDNAQGSEPTDELTLTSISEAGELSVFGWTPTVDDDEENEVEVEE